MRSGRFGIAETAGLALNHAVLACNNEMVDSKVDMLAVLKKYSAETAPIVFTLHPKDPTQSKDTSGRRLMLKVTAAGGAEAPGTASQSAAAAGAEEEGGADKAVGAQPGDEKKGKDEKAKRKEFYYMNARGARLGPIPVADAVHMVEDGILGCASHTRPCCSRGGMRCECPLCPAPLMLPSMVFVVCPVETPVWCEGMPAWKNLEDTELLDDQLADPLPAAPKPAAKAAAQPAAAQPAAAPPAGKAFVFGLPLERLVQQRKGKVFD